jgi:HEAT repeat protein
VSRRPTLAAEVVSDLLESAGSATGEERAVMVESLRALLEYAPASLERALSDPSPEVRKVAVERAQDVGLLTRGLRDTDPGVREVAILRTASVLMGSRDLPAELQSEALAALVQLVRSDAPNRGLAALVLSNLEGGAAALGRLLAEPDEDVRLVALESLRDREAEEAVRTQLKDSSRMVRIAAARALARITRDLHEPVATLEGVLAESADDPKLRAATAFALVEFLEDSDEAVRFVRKFLDDSDEQVRGTAALALWVTGREDERASAIVEGILADSANPLHKTALDLRSSRRPRR